MLLELHTKFNLFIPGSIAFNSPHCEFNEVRYKLDCIKSFAFDGAQNTINKFMWPQFRKPSFEMIYRWFSNIDCFKKGYTSSQIDRALFALTNAQEYYSEPATQLLWSMIGIENLYCGGNEKMVDSLNTNTQIYLGERVEFKKIIKEMYGIRSKFIHGNLNFESVRIKRETDEGIDLSTTIYECCDKAIAVLIATLQQMIIDDRYELKFVKMTKLSDNPSPNTPVSETPD